MLADITLFTNDLIPIGSTCITVVARGGRLYPTGPVIVPVTTAGVMAKALARLPDLQASVSLPLKEDDKVYCRVGSFITLAFQGPIVSFSDTANDP